MIPVIFKTVNRIVDVGESDIKFDRTPVAVLGLGVDMIEIDRIVDALERRSGPRFEKRVFTAGEIEYCRSMSNPYPHFAARFAAKEAVMKAFGTGWSADVTWQGIEVVRDRRGKPHIRLNGKTAELAGKLGAKVAHVSLSHDKGRAMAAALLVGEPE
ncbi:MAG: holo-[acyl-carrier-protein] synthase [Candidatus Glassbacteria bacterium]|nr:holo-[acyl-carrier-protein] synthase [Candidatus Glassbacteria bacterium]